jgi:uncharacterized damage-inducible protein DinB
MVSVDYCRLMARYNRWMNERMYAAVSALPDAERTRDRGAFFRSIHGTLSHIVWADRIWVARLSGTTYDVPGYGATAWPEFAVLQRERDAADTEILRWAGRLTDEWLQGTLEYTRKADGATVRLAGWVAATHLFNHATHHRGQATTLMKQAGIDPGVTDLPWMPGVSQTVP